MTKYPAEPNFVAFYQMTPEGAVNFDDLRDLDMPRAGAVPSVGDFVHHIVDGQNLGVYQVKELHFDPATQRVAALVERVNKVPNTPFGD